MRVTKIAPARRLSPWAMADGLGRAGGRAIERAVYALIVANPLLTDGEALFSAAHANLQTSGAAPSVTTIDAARVAMALATRTTSASKR